MIDRESAYLLEADLHVRVSSRCRRAYLHDLRDGLQAISGALDLLARASAAGGANRPMIDRAGDLSRRAVSTYETSVATILDDLLYPADAPESFDVGDLLQENIRFLRNDAAAKDISIRFSRGDDATLQVPRRKLRLSILGLLTALVDRLPAGEEIQVSLERTGAGAVIGISAKILVGDTSSKEWLAVTVARNLCEAHDGRLEIDDRDASSRVRLSFPGAGAAA